MVTSWRETTAYSVTSSLSAFRRAFMLEVEYAATFFVRMVVCVTDLPLAARYAFTHTTKGKRMWIGSWGMRDLA